MPERRFSITNPTIFLVRTSWSRKKLSSAAIASSCTSSSGSTTSAAIGAIASGYLASRNRCTAAIRAFGSGLRRLRTTSSNRACGWEDASNTSAAILATFIH
jgi:hypothetical protein